MFVLQSFSQLTPKYGKDIGEIIKTNCNVKIFIGSDDAETRKEFSELCGQKKIKNFSVNTSTEANATSNTGASNQPLITVGMLERLNGDKKGDAIVSVRGYEPIWTQFTPSYMLNNVYFAAGKADIAKREARLFEKQNYVFDIMGKEVDEETERMLDGIEHREKEEQKDDSAKKKKKLEELDREWDKIHSEIIKRVEQCAYFLKGKHAQALKAASLENKVPLLHSVMEEYGQTEAKHIQNLADYISMKLPKLIDLQEQAKK